MDVALVSLCPSFGSLHPVTHALKTLRSSHRTQLTCATPLNRYTVLLCLSVFHFDNPMEIVMAICALDG